MARRRAAAERAVAAAGRRAGGAVARGLVAGAAGTVALNAVTYADMLVRGRPPSPVPDEAVRALAARASIPLGAGDAAAHRTTAVGALLGYAAGLAGGVAWTAAGPLVRRLPAPLAAAALAAAIMAATDGASAVLGTTDPRTWSAADWAADVVPHLAYGAATVATDRLLAGGYAPLR